MHFSLPSIILADLLGNRTLLKRVQKVFVCDLWLMDVNPFCVFLFQDSWTLEFHVVEKSTVN